MRPLHAGLRLRYWRSGRTRACFGFGQRRFDDLAFALGIGLSPRPGIDLGVGGQIGQFHFDLRQLVGMVVMLFSFDARLPVLVTLTCRGRF